MPSDFDVSRPRLIRDGSFLERDWHEIARRRRVPNRLGFAYQVAFVRVLGRFPQPRPSGGDARERKTHIAAEGAELLRRG